MSNPAASFEPYRRRLLGLAYRMLGSMADAEDAVQETYMRWQGADRDKVSNPRAFLMTTTTRICLDLLTSARARREEYVGQWLPEPVLDTAALAPDRRTELAEDLSIALLLTLDRLSPLERAAFLLHDVFDFSFSEVAPALERSEAACRQLATRARSHVREARPRGTTASASRSGEIDAKHAQLMSAFIAATGSGDLGALTQLLASDVRVVTDGGGKVRAALNVVEGADRAAQFLVDVTRAQTRRRVVAGRLHAALCDHQRPARRHRGLTRGTGADLGVRDRGRRDPGAVRGAQSGQVAAFGGGVGVARERSADERSREGARRASPR